MNVPKLRFKEFNDEWVTCTINSVAEVISGGTPDTTNSNYWDGSINWFTPSEVGKSKYISNSKRKITQLGLQKSSAKLLPVGTILLSSRATVGESSILSNNEACTNQGFQSLIPHKNINNEFLYYLIYKYKKSLLKQAFGSTFLEISKNNVEKIKINIPTSMKEQIKLSTFLSLLDRKIELQTKKIEALKLFKLSITQNIFNEKKLNDFQSVTLGKILKPGSKIPVKNTSEYEKMTVKLNFKGLAKLETKKEMADTRPFYVRNENEIIIGKQNYFNGSIAKVTKDFKGCICSNAIMSFTTINGVNVDYVLYYLSQKNYINRRKFLANGTGQKELSEKEFLKFVIKLPSTQIQNNISKKISCVSNLLLLENKKLTTLKNLKKGLLQNMFI